MELIGINAELTHFPGADPEILEGGGSMSTTMVGRRGKF